MQVQDKTVVKAGRQRGFSLSELLVAVGILAVLIALAAPSMASFVAEWRVHAAANTLQRDIRLGKAEAIKRSRTVVLCQMDEGETLAKCGSGKDWRHGWLLFVDDNGNKAFDAEGDDALLLQQGPLPGLRAYEYNRVSSKFVFGSEGLMVSAVNGTFTVKSSLGGAAPKYQTCLVMSKTGRLRKNTDCSSA